MAQWLARIGEVLRRPRKTAANIERVSNPVQTEFVSHLVGRPNPPKDFDLRTLIHEGYRRNVIIYTCINEIASSVAAPKICIRKKDSDEEIDKHPALDLLNAPHPELSRYKLFETALIHLETAATSFIHKGRNSSGQVIQLKNLRPDRMYPLPDSRGDVAAYEYRGEGQARGQVIPRDDLIIAQLPDPLNDYHGLPPILVCAEFGDIDNEAAKYLRSFFMNGAMPMGLLSLELPNVPKEIRAAIQQEWRDSFGRGDGKDVKWFDIAVLSGNAKYQAVGTEPTGLRLESVWGMSETRICATFGVPPQIVAARIGMQFSTYSNYEEARKSFWEETLAPMYRRLSDTLTFELGREYPDEPEIVFDLESVEALQESEDSKAERVRLDYEKGVLTLNEAREVRGYDPIKTDWMVMPQGAKKLEDVEDPPEEPPPGQMPPGMQPPLPPGQKGQPPPFGAKQSPDDKKEDDDEQQRTHAFIIEHTDWPDREVHYDEHKGRWITYRGRPIFIGGDKGGGGGGGGGGGKGKALGGGEGDEKKEPREEIPAPVTFDYEGREIYLARAPGLNKEQRAVETKFMEEFARDPKAMVDRYIEEKGKPVDPETGKWTGSYLVSADDSKELSSDYMKDNDARTLHAPAVHETASQIADLAYEKILREARTNPEPGKNPDVIFTAGGAGSGKTSVSLALVPSVKEGQIVVDSTLSPNGGRRRIKQALAHGYGAVVVYTHRDPVEAYENGVIPRAKKRGRFVPPDIHFAGHSKSRQGIERHYKEFGDNIDVEFKFIDNSLGKGKAVVYDSLDKIPTPKVGKESSAAMKSRLLRMYRAGDLPAPVLAAAGIPIPKAQSQHEAADVLETFEAAPRIEVVGLGKIPSGAEQFVASRFPSLERGFSAAVDVLERDTKAEALEEALARGAWREAERLIPFAHFSERWDEELSRTLEDIAFSSARLHYEHHAPGQTIETFASYGPKIRDFVRSQVRRDLRHIERDMKRVIRAEMLRIVDKGGEIKASKILHLVGLTERQAERVQKLRDRLAEQGMAKTKAQKAVDRFTIKLRRERAQLIAEHQTRLAEAIGQRAAWERLFAEKKLKGGRRHWHKLWITADDERLCPRCEALDHWEIPLDRFFEEDEEESFFGPPIHPRCRCRLVLVETVPGWRAQEVSEGDTLWLEAHEGRWVTIKGRPIFIGGGKAGGGGGGGKALGGGGDAPRLKDGTLADERDGSSAPKPGQEFVVYRLGSGRDDLRGNAANAEGVADHLLTMADIGSGAGSKITAYKVTVKSDFGTYQMVRKGKALTEDPSSAVGRNVAWSKDGRASVNYSFVGEAEFEAKKIGTVSLAEAESILKARGKWGHVTGGDEPPPWGGERTLTMGGTLSVADGIREVFKPEKQEADGPDEGHAGKSIGQGFWFTKDGKRIFAGKGGGGGGGGGAAGGGGFLGGAFSDDGKVQNVDDAMAEGKLTKVGGSLGGHSNAGVFQTAAGDLLYIKHTDATTNAGQMAANEVIMAKLYDVAGFQVKDHAVGTWEGKPAVITKMLSHKGNATADTPGVKEGFATDAWLANWDVVGMSGDNLVTGDNGFALRVDVGGAGLFRGTGKAKGHAFGNDVQEIHTLRGKPTPAGNVNETGKWMFHGVTKQDVIDGVRNHVAKVTDAEIDGIVSKYGKPLTPAQRTELTTKLKARRDYLVTEAQKYEDALKAEAKGKTPDKPRGIEDISEVPAGGKLYTESDPPKISKTAKLPEEPAPYSLSPRQAETLQMQNKMTSGGKATLTNWNDPLHPRPDHNGVPTNPNSPLYKNVETRARNGLHSWKGSAQNQAAVDLKRGARDFLGLKEGQAYGEHKVAPDSNPEMSRLAAGMIYRDTQLRLAKAGLKNEDRIRLYRGVSQEITNPGYVEGHSTSLNVAKGFDAHEVQHRVLPPQALFAQKNNRFVSGASYAHESEYWVITPGLDLVPAKPQHVIVPGIGKKGATAAPDADPTGWWKAPEKVTGSYGTAVSDLDDLAKKFGVDPPSKVGEAPPKTIKGVDVVGSRGTGAASALDTPSIKAKVGEPESIGTAKYTDFDVIHGSTPMALGVKGVTGGGKYGEGSPSKLSLLDGTKINNLTKSDVDLGAAYNGLPTGKKALLGDIDDGYAPDHPAKKWSLHDPETLEPLAAVDNMGSVYPVKKGVGVDNTTEASVGFESIPIQAGAGDVFGTQTAKLYEWTGSMASEATAKAKPPKGKTLPKAEVPKAGSGTVGGPKPTSVPTGDYKGVGVTAAKAKPSKKFKQVPASEVNDYIKTYTGGIPKWKIAKIYQMKAQGKTAAQIASALGMGKSHVSGFLYGYNFGVQFIQG